VPILRLTDGEERLLLSVYDLWQHQRLLIDRIALIMDSTDPSPMRRKSSAMTPTKQGAERFPISGGVFFYE